MAWQPKNEADQDDPENPDPEDMDDSDDPEVIDCQYCGKSISEEAERCPHCGNYISREDAPYDKKWWIVIGVVLLVIATLMWLWISGSTNPRPLIP